MLHRVFRLSPMILNRFLALTAIQGGIGLLAGLAIPPVEQLAGSIFSDYTLPGMELLVVVGGGAMPTTALLIRRHPLAASASLLGRPAGTVVQA